MYLVQTMSVGEAVFMGLLLIAAGILLFEVGRRSAAGTLKRNWIVGIRITSTLASDEAWDTAHRSAGRYLQIAAIGPLVSGIVTLFRPSGSIALIAILIGLGWLLVFIAVSGVAAKRALS